MNNDSTTTLGKQDNPRPPRRARLIALCVVLVGVLVAVTLLAYDARRASQRQDVRQAATAVATQEAVNLTTISFETAGRDLGRIIARATGTLKTQFESQQAAFPAVLVREKSVSVGRVLAVGVASQTGNTVEVLVAVDATVTSAPTGVKATSVVKHYRMDMRVQRVHGRWLVSQVAFAGVPQ